MFFFFNDTATTEIYTLSLHDALPISDAGEPSEVADDLGRDAFGVLSTSLRHATPRRGCAGVRDQSICAAATPRPASGPRSEEHTSELQSRQYLVCRLLLEKKKNHYSN